LTVAQTGQAAMSAAPHPLQNLVPSGFGVEQFGQAVMS
jgi:hypothetical protein